MALGGAFDVRFEKLKARLINKYRQQAESPRTTFCQGFADSGLR